VAATNPQSQLSVVVTVYTETQAIVETVERLLKSTTNALGEIVLVASQRSPVATARICEELANTHDIVRVHVQQHGPGVGWALREGMALAKYECVAIMSADLETEPEAVNRMFQKMQKTGADVVIGSRWMKGGGFRNYNRFKYLCNWVFQHIFKVVYWTPITDLTYGFKILKKNVIQSIPWESEFHEIYIETTVKPLQRGYTVEQVPTVWIGRTEGKSVNSFFRNFKYVNLAIRVRVGISPVQ
jgi:glycosyltransferase involved in cell wall biosynthesis